MADEHRPTPPVPSAREAAETVREALVGVSPNDPTMYEEKALAALDSLVAAAERAERLEEALRERDERLSRIHMWIEGMELRGIMNIATEDIETALAEAAAKETA